MNGLRPTTMTRIPAMPSQDATWKRRMPRGPPSRSNSRALASDGQAVREQLSRGNFDENFESSWLGLHRQLVTAQPDMSSSSSTTSSRKLSPKRSREHVRERADLCTSGECASAPEPGTGAWHPLAHQARSHHPRRSSGARRRGNR